MKSGGKNWPENSVYGSPIPRQWNPSARVLRRSCMGQLDCSYGHSLERSFQISNNGGIKEKPWGKGFSSFWPEQEVNQGPCWICKQIVQVFIQMPMVVLRLPEPDGRGGFLRGQEGRTVGLCFSSPTLSSYSPTRCIYKRENATWLFPLPISNVVVGIRQLAQEGAAWARWEPGLPQVLSSH